MSQTPEGKLKDELKGYLRAIEAFGFIPRPTMYGQNGVDFLCCIPVVIRPEHVGQRLGVFAAIETKIWPRKATPLQKLCLQQVRDAGGLGFVAYDMATVYANLKVLLP